MCAITSQLNPYLRHLIKKEAIISSPSFGSPARSIRSRMLRVKVGAKRMPAQTRPSRRAVLQPGVRWGRPRDGVLLPGRTVTARCSQALGVAPASTLGCGRAKVLRERGRAMDTLHFWVPELSRDWNTHWVRSGQGCSSEAAAHNSSFGFVAAMGNSVRPFPCRRHCQLCGPFWPEVLG